MKIFTQYIDTKFINSLADIQQEELKIASANIQQNLYKIHYTYNFDVYIFCADLLTKEIDQFIKEFVSQKKIIIYHPHEVDNAVIGNLPKECIHIAHRDSQNIITIPYLVNEQVFVRYNDSDSRKEDILCFLDNHRSLPKAIIDQLYPNNKLPIKLFSKHILNPQNLGIITDQEKNVLLNNSKYYLGCDTGYEVEAVLCGASVIDIVDGKIKEKAMSDIPPFKSYQDFLLTLV